jgi:lysophospholipase L1-like esterase
MAAGAGVAAILLALELGLRLTGTVYTMCRAVPCDEGHERRYTIVCLGDSFTMGLGAPRGMDYPSQLERLLNGLCTGPVFRVINNGMATQNTAQVLDKLTRALYCERPDAVVILTGGPNEWNHWGFRDEGGRAHTRATHLVRKLLYRIRLFKLAMLMAHDVRNKRDAAAAAYARDWERLYDEGVAALRARNIEVAVAALTNAIAADGRRADAYIALAEAYANGGASSNALRVLQQGMLTCSNDARLYLLAGRVCYEAAEYDAGTAWFGAGLARLDETSLQALVHELRVNPYDAGYYVKSLRGALASLPPQDVATCAPKLRALCAAVAAVETEDAAITTAIREALPAAINGVEERAGAAHAARHTATPWAPYLAWARADLLSILRLCAACHVPAVVQNYPMRHDCSPRTDIAMLPAGLRYQAALEYEVIAPVAESCGVPLVDHKHTFDALQQAKDAFFVPTRYGEHPNARGYGLMAQRLFETMLAHGALGWASNAFDPVRLQQVVFEQRLRGMWSVQQTNAAGAGMSALFALLAGGVWRDDIAVQTAPATPPIHAQAGGFWHLDGSTIWYRVTSTTHSNIIAVAGERRMEIDVLAPTAMIYRAASSASTITATRVR